MPQLPWDKKRQEEITRKTKLLMNMLLDPDCLRKSILPLFDRVQKQLLLDGTESSIGMELNLEQLKLLACDPNISNRDLIAIKGFLECWLQD